MKYISLLSVKKKKLSLQNSVFILTSKPTLHFRFRMNVNKIFKLSVVYSVTMRVKQVRIFEVFGVTTPF